MALPKPFGPERSDGSALLANVSGGAMPLPYILNGPTVLESVKKRESNYCFPVKNFRRYTKFSIRMKQLTVRVA